MSEDDSFATGFDKLSTLFQSCAAIIVN